jgi:hypothetical protein
VRKEDEMLFSLIAFSTPPENKLEEKEKGREKVKQPS